MKTFAIVLGFALSFAVVASASPIDLSQAKSKVEFLAVGQPSALKIRGKLQENSPVKGTIEITKVGLQGEVSLPLDQFDTGIELRNRHMKEKYLETQKYPSAKLQIKPVAIAGDFSKSPFQYSGPFEGTLTLHGVEKPVAGSVKLESVESKWKGTFQFDFVLEDFGIEIPKYLGITVSKKVQVEANFQQ